MDKKIELLNFIIVEVENIGIKKQYRLSNSICYKKSSLLVGMSEEEKTDDISADVICGNVSIRKLKYGNYKVNKIHVKTYDGHLVTSIQYT